MSSPTGALPADVARNEGMKDCGDDDVGVSTTHLSRLQETVSLGHDVKETLIREPSLGVVDTTFESKGRLGVE